MKFSEWAKSVAGTAREHLGVAAVSVGVIVAMALVAAGSFTGCREQSTVNAAETVATFPLKKIPVSVTPASETVVKTTPGNAIIVYVTGAVKRPGVYTLAHDARLYHAIRAAGGFKTNAVTDALNLADRAQDGDQLCIPSRKSPKRMAPPIRQTASLIPGGIQPPPSPPLIRKTLLPAPVILPATPPTDETAPTVTVIETPPAPGRVLGVPTADIGEPTNAMPEPPSAPVTATISLPATAHKTERTTTKTGTKFKNPGDGVVHINSATAAELEQLPRCGPAMSAKILAYRAQIGKFTDTKQLMDVKGCGEKTFAKWQPFLAL
ncbi:MAG: helix-hairpin-helix domain-containing protein [Akkermansiaceae bacterium]|nr:helix-hairpin-helix domain-containing protein [Armatimonadota bacterium]